ncbi:replicative DNA helicase [Candidatus Nomurabacteria bacterium]|nr:replicative DNA helicase [Candidatus Nomurabacteria bacterium]
MEKIPPHSIDAEMSLLGSILIDKEAMLKVADALDADDFYKPAHKLICESMQQLYQKSEPVDVLTLSNKLEEKEQLEKVGGRAYLAKLSTVVPTATNIENYSNIVKKKATLRRLIQTAGEIDKLGYQEDEELDTTLDGAQQLMYQVTQKHLKQSFSSIRHVLSDAFERIDLLHKEKGKLRGVPSGFKELDNLLAGFQKSDLIILAARPSVGKTSLALDFARYAAVNANIPVGVFSLEMSKEQLVDRLLCAQAGVNLWKMRTGNLSDSPNSQDFPRIGQAMGVLSEAPVYIDDTASTNVMQIKTKARRLKAEYGLGLIIVDYLQLMESSGKKYDGNRVQEVSEMSRQLKLIAKDLNIPIICLSQLSRAVEQTKPAVPKLSHLRESGSIEQDADVVMFIYRKAADRNYRLEDIPPDERNIGEIHVAKHRNGPTGVVKVFFDTDTASYKDLDVKHMGATPPPPSEVTATPQF